MNRNEIFEIVIRKLKEIISEISEINDQIKINLPSDLNESTRLIGKKAVLDSLGLVNLIVGIEQEINDLNETSITIADERAMSMEKSPFRSVGTLVDYICLLINENSKRIS